LFFAGYYDTALKAVSLLAFQLIMLQTISLVIFLSSWLGCVFCFVMIANVDHDEMVKDPGAAIMRRNKWVLRLLIVFYGGGGGAGLFLLMHHASK